MNNAKKKDIQLKAKHKIVCFKDRKKQVSAQLDEILVLNHEVEES